MTCIQELYASACLYTLRPGLFSRGGEHSGTCYHENTVKHNKAAGDWTVQGLTLVLVSTFALPVSPKTNPSSLFAVGADWWTRDHYVLTAAAPLPHGSMVVVQVVDFVVVRVPVMLVPHGVLMHRSVGLGRGIEGGWDAVTGLAAVVAVPVVHSAVRILICSRRDTGRQHEERRQEVSCCIM